MNVELKFENDSSVYILASDSFPTQSLLPLIGSDFHARMEDTVQPCRCAAIAAEVVL